VGFRAGDGVGLRGRLFGRGTAAVVLAHMGNAVSNEADWYPLARRLAREGFLVLTYNRRAVCSGEKAHYDCSAGANDWGKAWQDVVGAVKFVESRGARRVAVGGSSIGGTSVVYAAATGRIHPVALISLAGVNHIDTYSLTRADVRRIAGAKLFVSGRRDPDGAAASAREFNSWARPPKRMVLLNTDYHGTDMFARTAGPGIGRQLTKLIVRFLRASMPPEP
jgi:dienelactone hydrolase